MKRSGACIAEAAWCRSTSKKEMSLKGGSLLPSDNAYAAALRKDTKAQLGLAQTTSFTEEGRGSMRNISAPNAKGRGSLSEI